MRRLEERVVLDAAAAAVVDDQGAEEQNGFKAGGLGVDSNTGAQLQEGGEHDITDQELSSSSSRPAENITYTITDLPDFGQVLLNGTATTSFTQADINAGRVSYLHDGSEGSFNDSFNFTVKDDVTGEATGSFSFTINPVNDEKPAVDLNGAASGRGFITSFTENSDPIAIVSAGEVDITDADSDAVVLQGLTVTLTNNLNGNDEALSIDVGNSGLNSDLSYGNGQAVLTISGEASIASYEQVLNTLSYVNNADNLNEDARVIEVTAFDGVNTSDVSTILVTMQAVNDAPEWSHPAAQTAVEETATTVTGISIADVDANNGTLDVTLSVSNGTLNLPDSSGLTLLENNGSANLHLQGSLDDINNALAQLSYTGDQDFNGVDTLQLFVNDQGNTGGGNLTASSSIQIDLSSPASAVNDAPVIAAPDNVSGTEDTSLSFTDIAISDVDAGDDIVRVTLTAPDGVLTLAQTTGLAFSQGDGQADPVLEFEGTVANINAALAGLGFSPNSNFNGNTHIQIQVNDQSATAPANQTAAHTIDIDISGENDAPVWSHPASQAAVEETPTVISGITLADVDAGDGVLDVTLSVNHGTIELPITTGLTLVENNGSPSIHLQGDLDSINNALTQLTYTSDVDFNELDELQLFVNDQGNTGGGDLTDSSSMVIDLSNASVSSVNDAPVISGPDTAQINEDTGINFTDISVTDVDAGSDQIRVTLSVDNGSLTLASTTGLSFSRGDGQGDAEVEFEGTLDEVNAALNGLTFTPAANFNGNANLNISVNDQSDIAPTAQTDDHSIVINVVAQNDAPQLVTNNILPVTDPSEPAIITSAFLSGADVDNPDAELHFLLSSLPENGVLTLNGNPLAAGDQFSQVDVDSGLLVYTPLNNGALTDSFDFQLCDPDTVSAQTTAGIPFQIVYTAPSKSIDVPQDSTVYQASQDLFSYGARDNGGLQAPVAQDFGRADSGLDTSRPDHFANALNAIDQAAQGITDGGLLASGVAGAQASGGMSGQSAEGIAQSCSEVAGLGSCNLAASNDIESRLSNAQPELLGRYLDAGPLELGSTAPGVEQGLLEPSLLAAASECNSLNEAPEAFAADYRDQEVEACDVPELDPNNSAVGG